MKLSVAIFLVAATGLLAGCQGYRDLATRGSNAFHDITLEVSDQVKSVAAVENLKIERKAHAGASFIVSGDISYGNSCRAALMIGVSFVNEKGVVLLNRKAPIQSYNANTKARFNAAAYINAKVGETQDIIDKVILTDISCV
jgi:hypothetical protein